MFFGTNFNVTWKIKMIGYGIANKKKTDLAVLLQKYFKMNITKSSRHSVDNSYSTDYEFNNELYNVTIYTLDSKTLVIEVEQKTTSFKWTGNYSESGMFHGIV